MADRGIGCEANRRFVLVQAVQPWIVQPSSSLPVGFLVLTGQFEDGSLFDGIGAVPNETEIPIEAPRSL
jgi:hypothetical protein